jgi:DNA-binding MarR family transcriptional regulator
MKPVLHASNAPADAPEILALERFVPFRLSVLANRLTRAVARVYSQRFRLSAPEWRTMAVLGRYGAMTANNVVERTAMDKVRVSRSVARLLSAGHITRQADPEDRRRAILDLTQNGRETYRQIVPLVLAVEAELLTGLDPEERALFDRVMVKLEVQTSQSTAAADDLDDDAVL